MYNVAYTTIESLQYAVGRIYIDNVSMDFSRTMVTIPPSISYYSFKHLSKIFIQKNDIHYILRT